MKISDLSKKKRGNAGSWKIDIANYIKNNQGCTRVEVYDATRPDKKDKIDASRKSKDLSSQFNYLKDLGYWVETEDNQCYLVTEPSDEKGECKAVEGQEDRAKQLFG